MVGRNMVSSRVGGYESVSEILMISHLENCLAVAVLWVVWDWMGCASTPEDGQTTGNLTPMTTMAASPRLLEQGKTTFGRNCAPCHGVNG